MSIINGKHIPGFGKKYKICGKFIWSESKQKIIKPYRGSYCLYDLNGNKVKLTLEDIEMKNNNRSQNKFFCLFFCLLIIFLILYNYYNYFNYYNYYNYYINYIMLKFPDSL